MQGKLLFVSQSLLTYKGQKYPPSKSILHKEFEYYADDLLYLKFLQYSSLLFAFSFSYSHDLRHQHLALF